VARDATGRQGPLPGDSRRPGRAASSGGRAAGNGASGKAAAAAAAAALRAAVCERLAPALAEAGFDLDDLSLARAGSRSVLRVAVDREDGVDLDAVAGASHLISDLLDRVGDEIGLTGAYVLEVTSPGVDRPLTEPRHWRRARGRLVETRRADGAVVVGRVLGSDDAGADLAVATGPAVKGRPARTRIERVLFADVTRAVVQVEFGTAAESASPGPGGGQDGDGLPVEGWGDDGLDDEHSPEDDDEVWDELGDAGLDSDDQDRDDQGRDAQDRDDLGGGRRENGGTTPPPGAPARRGTADTPSAGTSGSPGEETDR
jgi:ribosome maturation factor RimP